LVEEIRVGLVFQRLNADREIDRLAIGAHPIRRPVIHAIDRALKRERISDAMFQIIPVREVGRDDADLPGGFGVEVVQVLRWLLKRSPGGDSRIPGYPAREARMLDVW